MGTAVLQTRPSEEIVLVRCPACGANWSATKTVQVHAVEETDHIAGGTALESLNGCLVYARCDACGSLVAVDARRQPGVLDQIYRELPAAYWDHLNPQDRFAKVLEEHLAGRHSGGDVWDVGCGTGTLLTAMSDRWTKHGIEPGATAVATAQRLGFDVRQGTAQQLGLQEVADVALLVDVIEHMPDPEAELQAIYRMLRPGGTLAVFTGRADALPPRMAGRLWYYLHCVGHVTVFSRRALCGMLGRVGLTNIEAFRVEHQGAVSSRRWFGRIGGNLARVLLGRSAAPMNFYHDHQLVLASKPR